jgi:hypothetical protein
VAPVVEAIPSVTDPAADRAEQAAKAREAQAVREAEAARQAQEQAQQKEAAAAVARQAATETAQDTGPKAAKAEPEAPAPRRHAPPRHGAPRARPAAPAQRDQNPNGASVLD